MRRILVLAIFSLFGSSLFAQPSSSLQKTQLSGSPMATSPNFIQSSNFSRTFKNQINIPNNISSQDRTKIQDLIDKLQNACPSCSTSGTIGGEVIRGDNLYYSSSSDSTGLFGGETIRIKKSEYTELKRKAAFYVMYKSQYDEIKRKAMLYDNLNKKK